MINQKMSLLMIGSTIETFQKIAKIKKKQNAKKNNHIIIFQILRI